MSLVGGVELLFIAMLALIIIGPHDLPKVLRAVGKSVRTLRVLSADFIRMIEGMSYDKESRDTPHPPESSH